MLIINKPSIIYLVHKTHRDLAPVLLIYLFAGFDKKFHCRKECDQNITAILQQNEENDPKNSQR